MKLAAREAAPLGVIFGTIGVGVAAVVSLLGLDRLGFSLCYWKIFTGLPCPTCGGTRALACLAHLDLAGAFAMNPLVTVAAFLIAAWALADLALLPSRRAFAFELQPGPARLLRVAAVFAIAANWVYLVAAGR